VPLTTHAPDAIDAAIAARPSGHHLLLVLDFASALIDPDAPDRLAPRRRAILARLAHQPDTSVAVSSWRPLVDVTCRVGLSAPVLYVGLRGLEVAGQGIAFAHAATTESVGLVARIARSLSALTADLQGVTLEHHGPSLTLHLGDATPAAADLAEEALDRVAASHVANDLLRPHRTARAIEVLPSSSWDEADALALLRTELGQVHARPVWPVCIADDVRGARLFQAVEAAGVSVAVGDRPGRASFRLRDADGVERLLRRLLGDA
jgi:trehalose-phosphatase